MSLRSAIAAAPVIGPISRRFARSRLGSIALGILKLGKVAGVHPRSCTVCEYRGYFRAFGDPPRWDARCPHCGSLERHRLLALLIEMKPKLIRGRVIHFAPEPNASGFVKPLADQYQTADLFRRECDLLLNIESMDLSDKCVDAFITSHVLEHVDDARALGELFRCLKPSGVALIMVPIVEGWEQTYENSAVMSERDREVHFGQFDHVRYYGSDLRDRIRDAGFTLEEFTASPDDCVRYGLMRGEKVFVARRPLTETVA